MKIKQNKGKKVKKWLMIGLVAITLVIAYAVTAFFMQLPPFEKRIYTDNNSNTPKKQYTNMNRTDTEKEVSKKIEKKPEKKLENNQTDTPKIPPVKEEGKRKVNVLLTNTGIFNNIVSASGMVTNAVENDGNCQFIFTNGQETIQKKSSTLTNPTSTTCKTVSFKDSELQNSGTWKVTIKYTSDLSEGTSNTEEFTK